LLAFVVGQGIFASIVGMIGPPILLLVVIDAGSYGGGRQALLVVT
jgi:hypothetical protein